MDDRAYIITATKSLLYLIICTAIILIPYTCWWIYLNGDVGVERAVKEQSSGNFTIFGSGVSQDFVDYKLQLYKSVKPEIAAVGSSRVMQFRGSYFRKNYLNIGGVAGNLAVLRSTLEAMLKIHKPEAIILGLDFWWFLPQWEAKPFNEVPPTSGSYNYSFDSLKKPWTWLLEGKITIKEFFNPILSIFGNGIKEHRYGIMAQQTNDGFGPDGSWYYTADITGQKHPYDYKFADTLDQVTNGIKAFYWANDKQTGPSEEHLDAFAEIYCRLKARGIKTFVFITPLSQKILTAMKEKEMYYPHLFKLKEALINRGIDVLDFTDPKSFASSDCEFIDGFHGGEIAYARILRAMSDRWPTLLSYVHMEKLNTSISDWQGHALVPNQQLTQLPEIDFMNFGCQKRRP